MSAKVAAAIVGGGILGGVGGYFLKEYQTWGIDFRPPKEVESIAAKVTAKMTLSGGTTVTVGGARPLAKFLVNGVTPSYLYEITQVNGDLVLVFSVTGPVADGTYDIEVGSQTGAPTIIDVYYGGTKKITALPQSSVVRSITPSLSAKALRLTVPLAPSRRAVFKESAFLYPIEQI